MDVIGESHGLRILAQGVPLFVLAFSGKVGRLGSST
jgi:hypothetical protein